MAQPLHGNHAARGGRPPASGPEGSPELAAWASARLGLWSGGWAARGLLRAAAGCCGR